MHDDDGAVTLVADRVFCVSDRCGNLAAHDGSDAAADHGLYAHDTRHLSRLTLTLDGRPPGVLSVAAGDAWARHVLVPETRRHVPPAFTLHRDRYVDPDGLVEELTLVAHAPVVTTLRLDLGADFADLFEVRGWRAPPRRDVRVERMPTGVRMTHRRSGFHASTSVTEHGDDAPGRAEPERLDGGLAWTVDLPHGGRWHARLAVRVDHATAPSEHPPPTGFAAAVDRAESDTGTFLAGAPTLHTDWRGLHAVWQRSLRDLALLRVTPPGRPDLRVPAAGLPWFGTLFGRDSLLTAWYALPYLPNLAADTLRALAGLQGREVDPLREEEPGKIIHELREGELTLCGDLPLGRYYGTVDSTPLFCCLLDAYHRQTGDDTLARELEPHARAALAWMEGHGDPDGDGYLEYSTHNPAALVNHCWKDSADSMRHADGSLAVGPVAVCEAQGYAFDAYRRTARLARRVWGDTTLAVRLDARADRLRQQFAADFWMADRDYPALALDGDKRQVGAVTSNAGHVLASGILGQAHADAVAHRLMSDGMFSGWGLRTMSADEPAYHPLVYHNGTVWPHDTALAAAGLARYGHHDAAARLAAALVEAAGHFGDRLPEVFAGYPRGQTAVPVQFPTACSPQAWAAAAPLLLVTSLIGPDGQPTALPDGVGLLQLSP